MLFKSTVKACLRSHWTFHEVAVAISSRGIQAPCLSITWMAVLMIDLERLTALIRKFNDERDWDQYHSPKNLASSLVIEAAELLEIFQWLTEDESASLDTEKRKQVKEEIGDVLIYLLNLADKLGIDPAEATIQKLKANEEKYPVEKARGSAAKYTEL